MICIPQDNPLIQTTSYAFVIWGLFYIWLIIGTGFGIFALVDSADSAKTPPVTHTGGELIAVAQSSVIWR